MLRLWNLNHQLLMGDEFHAIRAALDWDFLRIFTTYRLSDNSIPLTAGYRLLTELGVALSETVLRLPSVVSGLALLVALPRFARRELGRHVALIAALLVAISPSLVYYSRIARPYAVITVLCFVAVAAFWKRWERGGRWWWGLVYSVAGAAAIWFHLGSGPLIVAPLVFASLDVVRLLVIRAPEALARLRSLLTWALALLAMVLSFLVPARATFLRLLRVRPQDGSLTVDGVSGSLALQAGSAWLWVAGLFWAAALIGLLLLLRDRPRLGLYWTCVVGIQWLAIALVLQPSGVEHAVVLNRYLLVTLPFVLLWVATSLDRARLLVGRMRLRRWGRSVPIGFVSLLFLGGPYIADPALHFGSFAGSHDAMNFLERLTAIPAGQVPEVYFTLAREPGREPVLEAPRATPWWRNRGPLAYSRVHGRHVLIGSDEKLLQDPRLRLRTIVPLDVSSLAESGARFIIVNLDPGDPMRRPEKGDPAAEALPRTPRGRLAKKLAQRLEGAWGEPSLVDGPLRVWDLARIRYSQPGGAGHQEESRPYPGVVAPPPG